MKRYVHSIDEVLDSDVGYINDRMIVEGIPVSTPVLVKEYKDGAVLFITKTGKIIDRNATEFERTWWFMRSV